jgi:hypothetical protein
MVNGNDRRGVIAHLSIFCDASIGQSIHTLLVTGPVAILPAGFAAALTLRSREGGMRTGRRPEDTSEPAVDNSYSNRKPVWTQSR